MKYRKKPIVIDAIQWTGTNYSHISAFLGYQPEARSDRALIIHTLECDITPSLDDWIIRGVKGEFYPCKPDIFAATYEPADEP